MIRFDNQSDKLLLVPFCLRLYREECYSERGYRLRIVRSDSRSQIPVGTRRDKKNPEENRVGYSLLVFPGD